MKKNKSKINNKRVLLLAVLLFLLSTLVLLMLNKYESKKNNDKETGNRDVIYSYYDVFPHHKNLDQYKKLLYQNIGVTQKDIDDMVKAINDYLGKDIQKVSISYYDINTSLEFNINEKVEVTAASTVKVPISMMLYDEINKGNLKEDDTMMYKSNDFEESYGGIGYEDTSQPKTFKHINECMIKYSDNVAVNMLLRYFGNNKRYSYIESVVGHSINRSGNYTTAEDTMKILKRLYNNPDNNPYYPQIIEQMKNTAFHERLDKYLPYDIVAHKIGDFSNSSGNSIHDVGIIYTDHPYILVVLTKNLSGAYDKIANISKIIYNIQNER